MFPLKTVVTGLQTRLLRSNLANEAIGVVRGGR